MRALVIEVTLALQNQGRCLNALQVLGPEFLRLTAIEHFTGLDFLTALPDDVAKRVEKVTATELWPED